MFEKASKLKIRFESPKGSLTVEDLWDLPLTSSTGKANLNDIAKGISRELRENEDEDFVNTATKPNELLALKMEVVKRVIAERLAENQAAKQAADRREKKQRIMALMAQKQDEVLASKSLDELQAMMAEL